MWAFTGQGGSKEEMLLVALWEIKDSAFFERDIKGSKSQDISASVATI